MDTVDQIALSEILETAVGGSKVTWTRELLEAHAELGANELETLAAQVASFALYLEQQSDDRASRLRRVGETRLFELACLWPGVFKRYFARRTAVAPLEHLRSLDPPSRARAFADGAERLDEIVESLDALALIPPSLQSIVWSEPNAPATPMDTLTAMVERLDPPPSPLDLYGKLSSLEGQRLAASAIHWLEGGTRGGWTVAERLLHRLACLVPGALERVHVDLLGHGLLRTGGGVLFRGAGPDASALLLASEVADHDGWLKALSWIGDDAVRAAFTAWRREPPAWRRRVNVDPERYAYEAGWELTAEGGRRELCFEHCFRLEPERDTATVPVIVGGARDDRCVRCAQPLTTLFDLDLADARLGFLGLRGARVRLSSCTTCWSPSFSRFDGEGNAHSVDDGEEGEGQDFFPLRPTGMALAAARTCVEPRLGAGVGWMGGHPDWIDDADYPVCLSCDRSMTFVAQVNLDALDGAGTWYAFVCAECAMAATFGRCT
jgi:hypothetical protein